MSAGIEISLRIGQRVRHHQDFKGRRVIGVIQSLYLSAGVLSAEIGLDEPLVIDGLKESPPIKLYRQNVPAHELVAFDERDEQIAELLDVLRKLSAEAATSVEYSDWPELQDLVEKAETAIAKATGGAA